MTVSTIEWWALFGFFILAYVIDGVVVDRRPHEFSFREATAWVLFYIACAGGFAAWIWVHHGSTYGGQFVAGYLTEYSLSIDNLFVFLILMSSFAVPNVSRHKVLRIGVALSLILRGVLILVGSQAVERFSATLFLFAGLLLWTAVGVWRSKDEEPDPEDNRIVRILERLLPVSREHDGSRLLTKIDGKRHVTPLFLVILAIGVTNVIFALDSIPAVFGLTTEPFIIFSANAFALMGLRQIFFMLQGLMDRLTHMSKGLAVILAFIGVKLILEATADTFHVNIPQVSTWQSLLVILLVLAVTVLASAHTRRRNPGLTADSRNAEHKGAVDE